jgi:biopolymer transport protein ExbB
MIEVLFSAFVNLGAAWVLWTLVALSVVILAVGFERWWVIALSERRGSKLWQARVEPWLKSGVPSDWKAKAQEWQSLFPCPESQLMHSLGAGLSPSNAMAFVQNQRLLLERRLSILGTLGNNAPYLGLLGTVIGIIQAFSALGQGGSEIGLAALSAGLAEALVSTAIGIAVALEAVLLFNYFTRKIKVTLSRCDILQNLLGQPNG